MADAPARLELAPHLLLEQHQLGAEARRLCARPLGELGAADTTREAEIVLDPRAGAGLAAQGRALHQHGPQPFRGGIQRRAQPSGATAEDGDVVLLARRVMEPAELL